MATQKGRNWSSGDIVTAANLSSVERGVSAMAEEYTPTTWSNGDTVTAAGLNNIEQGIANAGGGGDFSTAQVTFINADTTTSPYAVNAFYVDSDCINMSPFNVSESVTIEVPLYKGKTEMSAFILSQTSQSYMPTTTGGASLVLGQGAPKFVITGDGTITAKGANQEGIPINHTGDCTITIS